MHREATQAWLSGLLPCNTHVTRTPNAGKFIVVSCVHMPKTPASSLSPKPTLSGGYVLHYVSVNGYSMHAVQTLIAARCLIACL